MRRIIAGLAALATITCVFTGCGSTSSESSSESTSSESASGESISESDIGANADIEVGLIDEGSTEEASKASSGSGKNSASDLETAFKGYLEAINNMDGKAFADYTFPIKMKEKLSKISDNAMQQAGGVDQYFGNMLESEKNSLPFTYDTFISKDCSRYLSGIQNNLIQAAKDAKIDTFDPEEYFVITDAYFVKADLISDLGQKQQFELVAYYLDNEGWKFDSSLAEYVKKADEEALDDLSSRLQKAANSSLADLKAAGNKIDGTYIISSDENCNAGLSDDFNVRGFYKCLNNYCTDLADRDYFVYIKDGKCKYVACTNGLCVSTKPSKSKSSDNGELYKMKGDETFDDLYELAKSGIKQ